MKSIDGIELDPSATPVLHEALSGLMHAVKDTSCATDPFVRAKLDFALYALSICEEPSND